jgi:hypothetical protein
MKIHINFVVAGDIKSPLKWSFEMKHGAGITEEVKTLRKRAKMLRYT